MFTVARTGCRVTRYQTDAHEGVVKAACDGGRDALLSGRESHAAGPRSPIRTAPEALHDVAPTVCQLTGKGVPVTALTGAEIEAVIACWTETLWRLSYIFFRDDAGIGAPNNRRRCKLSGQRYGAPACRKG